MSKRKERDWLVILGAKGGQEVLRPINSGLRNCGILKVLLQGFRIRALKAAATPLQQAHSPPAEAPTRCVSGNASVRRGVKVGL